MKKNSYLCDSCKDIVPVVRSGPGIEGEVCDKCANVRPGPLKRDRNPRKRP
jgi:ribosomal protein L37AE/L43A